VRAQIWDLESKGIVAELTPEFEVSKHALTPYCTSVAWSADGSVLYAGFTDGIIRVYGVNV
jgi:guanine nucleotide-binding protein subunit beta-2-like 1 protein